MDDRQPSEEEIEQRKQARAGGRGVERARSAPQPDKAPPAETAPAQGAEKE